MGKRNTRLISCFGIVIVVLMLSGCQSTVQQNKAALQEQSIAALNKLYQDYFDRLVGLHPDWAASLGREDLLNQYGDGLSESYRQIREDMARDAIAQLDRYKPSALFAAERLNYQLFRYARERELAYYSSDLARLWRMMPINQMDGLHASYAVQVSGDSVIPFRTLEHYEKALKRADGFAVAMDMAIARMREGVSKGVTIPRLLAEKVLPQVEAHIGKRPEETVFYHPIDNFPESITAEDRVRLAAAYKEKIATVIEPAYVRLAAFLRNEYIPNARETDGLSGLEAGAELYQNAIEESTTTTLTAKQIHAIGLAEVERISAELDALRQRLEFAGNLQEFLAWSRSNPSLFFAGAEDKMQRFEAVRQLIDARLPQFFNVMPVAGYAIKQVPDYLEQGRAAAYYQSPAPDGSRPGIFWVNTYKADQEPSVDVVTISLHEAAPGHHFQISISQQQKTLPDFRRFGGDTAYLEGWGLYAETLGKDMGLYQDPWQLLGHLSWEIHRANRLVVDTGLHAMGWSREQGIEWMMKHSAISEQNAIAEVERFMAMPGQALAYKIGQLKIQVLRERAEAALGERFDIRKFHDAILLNGSMPLPMLEAQIDNWIAVQAL